MSQNPIDDKSTLDQVMTITWANVNPDQSHHMVSPGLSELMVNTDNSTAPCGIS